MPRTIRSLQDALRVDAATEAVGPPPGVDDYKDRLLKYIPADVIALYVTLEGIVRSSDDLPDGLGLWVAFVSAVVATPFYLRRVAGITKRQQIAIATLSLVVWVFSLGGPFESLGWYRPVYGALLLPLFTFFVPIFVPKK